MGNNGGREARRKRALGSPASRLKTDRQRQPTHPDCVSVTDSPPPQAPFQIPHTSFGHTPSWNCNFCLPTIPKELALWRGVLVVLFLPEALALGAPAQVPWPLIWDEHSPRCSRAKEVRSGTASPLPHPGIQACLVLAILQDDVTLEGDTQCLSIPGVGEGTCWDSQVGGRERGAGSKPSSSHAGLSLSQTSCCQSPFRRSHYGASPVLSDESVPGASRGTGSQSGPASLQKGPA